MSAYSRLNPGTLLFHNGTTDDVEISSSNSLLTLAGPASAAVRLTGLATPTANADAATKQYVDSYVQGLGIREPVVAASTANVALSSMINAATLDGVTLATGDRILLKNQTTASQNGLWVVGADTTCTRPADFAAGANASSVYVLVDEGTINASKSFVCTTDKGAAVVDTDALAFTLFTTTATVDAGNGLTNNGGLLDVNVDGTTLQVTGDTLSVLSIPNAKLENYSLIVIPGTGLTNGGTVQLGQSVTLEIDTAVVPRLGAPNTFTDTTGATSSITASLVLAGGIGVAEKGYFGSDVHASAFYTDSDERLKKNIRPIDDAADVVESLEGVYFDWKSNNKPAAGFIAQQLQTTFPVAVDASNPDHLQVEYTAVVPLLVELSKSLKRRLDVVEEELRQVKQKTV